MKLQLCQKLTEVNYKCPRKSHIHYLKVIPYFGIKTNARSQMVFPAKESFMYIG